MSKIVVDTIESSGTTVTINDNLDGGTNTGTFGTITGLTATSLTSGTLAIARIADDAITAAKLESDIRVKAWVNFNGEGTLAIRDSYNISSVSDDGTGAYTINFTNNLADGTYAGSVTTTNAASSYPIKGVMNEPTSTGFSCYGNRNTSGSNVDSPYVYAIVFGDMA